MSSSIYDVIIIGSGPAGLTAAIYTTRADFKTLVLAGRLWGGQLMLTSTVENFPGFPEGIIGPDLMMRIRKQAEKYGAEIIDMDLQSADFSKKPFTVFTDGEKKYMAKSIIIATGAQTKWLGIKGEKEKIGRGVSSCAPCDAAFFRGKNVIVVGGGDAAMEEALVLTKFANHVYVVHRREELRASEIMKKRAFENKKITFVFNTEVTEILGKLKVEKVRLKSHTRTNEILIKEENQNLKIEPAKIGGSLREKEKIYIVWEFPIDGVFVAVGHKPNTKIFKGIELDEKGFVKISHRTRTNVDGVFVAGDVHDPHFKQAVTAAGFGAMAALDVEKWLEEQK